MDLILARQMVEYIQETQPQLDKAAALRERLHGYQVKVAQAIDTMVDRGLLSLQSKTAMYRDLAANPEKAADLLLVLIEKAAAARSQGHLLGGPSDRVDESGLDPILGFVMADHH